MIIGDFMIQLVNRSGKFLQQINENQKAALELVGEFIKGKMDIFAPVDTGYLKSRNGWVIQKNELYAYNDCPYAVYQEFGTYKMKAQPFMRPAVNLYQREIEEILEMGFKRGIN
jgi:HK97 gp10 family phage protein